LQKSIRAYSGSVNRPFSVDQLPEIGRRIDQFLAIPDFCNSHATYITTYIMTIFRDIRILFVNGVIVLLIFLVLVEAVTWGVASEAKWNFVKDSGGVLPYLGLLVRNTILPELVTIFVLALLINRIHRWVDPTFDSLTWKSLLLYQLSFLPALLTAFLIFIPFTQSIRYLLVEFPIYSFNSYWHKYIIDSYSLALYFKYLLPVMLIGYSALNISLMNRTLRNHSVV